MDLFTILTHAAALIVGALIGVGLARQSKKANAAYDRVRKEADELRAKYEALRAKHKD